MNTCSARTPDGAEKGHNRLLTRHPSGYLRVDVLQCTTSGGLRVYSWRAAHSRDCVFCRCLLSRDREGVGHRAFFSTVTPACSVHIRVNDFCVNTIAECAT
jgi:hypothetical protein